jgi:hypothetical protein
MLYAVVASFSLGYTLRAPAPRMQAAASASTDAAFGASHTSMYTDAVVRARARNLCARKLLCCILHRRFSDSARQRRDCSCVCLRAQAKDSYDTLEEVLAEKMADTELRSVLMTMFNGCGTITEALRKELVTVAEKQASVFGDVQLGVDVLADDLMWDICKTEPLIKAGASEEEPEVTPATIRTRAVTRAPKGGGFDSRRR